MKKVSKIIIVCVLITITLSTMFFLNKKESASSNGMFAIMLEEEKGTGKYENAKDNKWPQSDEYVINMYKTYCEKGSVLRWNNKTKRINATVKGTDKCYVYFDLSEYGDEEHPYLIQTIEDLVRLSNDVNNGTTYAGKYFLLTNNLDFQDEADYENANRVDFKDINGINGDEALITELTTGSGFVPIGTYVNPFQGNFNGNRIGGLVGALQAGIIIDKCFNLGNMRAENEIWSSWTQIGGLIGMASSYSYLHPQEIILNSYNVGNIFANNKTGTAIAGLLGNQFSNKLILLNSYNVGNVDLQSYSDRITGIIYSLDRNSQSTINSNNILNNVYNLGTISGTATNKNSLGYFDINTTTNNIENAYYINTITGTNLANVGTGMTLEQMKQQTFVEELNKNIESINLEDIDSSLKGYTLSKWALGTNGYPTLVNE